MSIFSSNRGETLVLALARDMPQEKTTVRIIHFLNHTYAFNGHVNVAVDLACVQARMGHSVALISQGGDFDALLESCHVQHIKIDQTRRPLTLLRAVYHLQQAFRSFQPDIVHAHMMTSAGLAFLLRLFYRFKLVTTVHNEFEKWATFMGLGDRVVAVSKVVSTSMARRGVAETKLCVVLNGTIGSPRLSQDLPAPQDLHHPAIMFVGGLHPRKGVADLITAFQTVAAKVPAAHLYLVGEGPYDQEYRRLAAQTGVGDRIEFCGSQPDPRSYLQGADLFVLASHSEPGALVLPEAREAGCAVIGTEVGGIPEMLDLGKAGLLVPPQRPDLLADAMVRVLTEEGLLTELKRRASENLAYFRIERVARDYLANYQELLDGIPLKSEATPCPAK